MAPNRRNRWSGSLVVCLTFLSVVLLSKGSYSGAGETQVMRNKLGSFDFEELESNLYRVEISSNPISTAAAVVQEEPWEKSEHLDVESSSLLSEDEAEYDDETRQRPQLQTVDLKMISVRGQRHLCSIPYSISASHELATSDAVLPNISDILNPLRIRPCLTMAKLDFVTKLSRIHGNIMRTNQTAGWWTYEYCHGKFMRQFHLEAGHIVGKTLYMGYYDNETTWDRGSWEKAEDLIKSVKSTLPGDSVSMVYHSVLYVNGTVCDLTEQPRRTVVKITCGLGEDKLISIQEKSTCNYEVSIHTPLLCGIPLFSNNVQPGREKLVTCSPVISKERYRAYLRKQEEASRVMEAQVCADESPTVERGGDTHETISRLSASEESAFGYDGGAAAYGDSVPTNGGEAGDNSAKSYDGNEASNSARENDVGQTASDFDEDDLTKALRDLFNKALSLGPQRSSAESERIRLLERLIRKIQPELTKVQMENRVAALKEKFKHFELADLRELVGAGPEEEEEEEEKANEMASILTLGKEEKSLLDELDEDSFAELEDEVTAELREKLSELGLSTQGTEVKLKVFKLSDLDLDSDDEDGDLTKNSETTDNSRPLKRNMKNEIKVVQMSLFPGFLKQKDDSRGRLERRELDSASALEAGYNTVWDEKEEDTAQQKRRKQ